MSYPPIRRLLASFFGTGALVLAAFPARAIGSSSTNALRLPTNATAPAPPCATSGLVVWLNTNGNGATGSIYYQLEFTNLSGHICTTGGYPGVSAADLDGHQIGAAGLRSGLKPAGLRVYPPNEKASKFVPFPFYACRKATDRFLQVGPLHIS